MSQEIKDFSGVFIGANVVSIKDMGKGMIPVGTSRLINLPSAINVLDTNGAQALVSVLENGPNAIAVNLNKNHLTSINLTVAGDESLKKVLKDGTIVPASAYESLMELDPGDISVFMFETEKK